MEHSAAANRPLAEVSQDMDDFEDDDLGDDTLSIPDSELGTAHADAPRASAAFSLKHPFQDIDPRMLVPPLVLAIGVATAGAIFLVIKRLRRQSALDVSRAWLWTNIAKDAGTAAPATPSKPLLGQLLVVNENVPVQGRPVALGVAANGPPAPANHSMVAALVDAGAEIAGVARVDPLALSGPFQTLSCSAAGNGGLRGRAVLGSCGAAATIVASGGATVALGVDSGAEGLLGAACTGIAAFRASVDAVDLVGCLRGAPSTSAASISARDASLLQKAGKALALPGAGPAPDVMRILFTQDLFEMMNELPGEDVTNGIVSRAVTSWLADSDNARQIPVMDYLSKALDKWPRFVEPVDGAHAAPSRGVLEAIARAHTVIVAFETRACVTQSRLDTGSLPSPTRAELDRGAEASKEEYEAALDFKRELHTHMRDALRGATILLPIIARAPSRVKDHAAPLDKTAAGLAALSYKFTAFISMCGFPTAVLPVPAPGKKRGAPWAVAIMGLYRTDQQVLQLAAKLAPQIIKTAAALGEDEAQPKKGKNTDKGRAESGASAASSGRGVARPGGAAGAKAAAEGLKDQGNAAFKAGEYVEAIKQYSTAIQLDPRNAVYYSNRAMAYLKIEQFPQAIADCDASISIKWTAKAALRRGTARAATGQWDAAYRDFEAVVAAEPNNKQAVQQAEECREMLATCDVENVAPVSPDGLL